MTSGATTTCPSIFTHQSPTELDSAGTQFDTEAPEASLFKYFTVWTDTDLGGFCAFEYAWIMPDGTEIHLSTGYSECTGASHSSYTANFASGERIIQVEITAN